MHTIDIRSEIKEPLNLNIKFMREKEGIPQKEIAKKLGVSRSTYSLWESSRERLSPRPSHTTVRTVRYTAVQIRLLTR